MEFPGYQPLLVKTDDGNGDSIEQGFCDCIDAGNSDLEKQVVCEALLHLNKTLNCTKSNTRREWHDVVETFVSSHQPFDCMLDTCALVVANILTNAYRKSNAKTLELSKALDGYNWAARFVAGGLYYYGWTQGLKPMPGAVFFRDSLSNPNFQHVGIVVCLNMDGTFSTVERSGDDVLMYKYTLSSCATTLYNFTTAKPASARNLFGYGMRFLYPPANTNAVTTSDCKCKPPPKEHICPDGYSLLEYRDDVNACDLDYWLDVYPDYDLHLDYDKDERICYICGMEAHPPFKPDESEKPEIPEKPEQPETPEKPEIPDIPPKHSPCECSENEQVITLQAPANGDCSRYNKMSEYADTIFTNRNGVCCGCDKIGTELCIEETDFSKMHPQYRQAIWTDDGWYVWSGAGFGEHKAGIWVKISNPSTCEMQAVECPEVCECEQNKQDIRALAQRLSDLESGTDTIVGRDTPQNSKDYSIKFDELFTRIDDLKSAIDDVAGNSGKGSTDYREQLVKIDKDISELLQRDCWKSINQPPKDDDEDADSSGNIDNVKIAYKDYDAQFAELRESIASIPKHCPDHVCAKSTDESSNTTTNDKDYDARLDELFAKIEELKTANGSLENTIKNIKLEIRNDAGSTVNIYNELQELKQLIKSIEVKNEYSINGGSCSGENQSIILKDYSNDLEVLKQKIDALPKSCNCNCSGGDSGNSPCNTCSNSTCNCNNDVIFAELRAMLRDIEKNQITGFSELTHRLSDLESVVGNTNSNSNTNSNANWSNNQNSANADSSSTASNNTDLKNEISDAQRQLQQATQTLENLVSNSNTNVNNSNNTSALEQLQRQIQNATQNLEVVVNANVSNDNKNDTYTNASANSDSNANSTNNNTLNSNITSELKNMLEAINDVKTLLNNENNNANSSTNSNGLNSTNTNSNTNYIR
jgi:hypothetical protein